MTILADMADISHLKPVERHTVLMRLRSALTAHAQEAGLITMLLLALWFSFSWFQTINHIVRDYSPIPVFDYWRPAAYLHFYQAFDFGILWKQHNEHRIVFPEIVFATDLLLLHGQEILPICFGFLCYFSNWLVLTWAFWSIQSIPPLLRAIGALVSGLIVGWQGSAFNIVDSFLLQWTLTQIAVLLSLAFLVRLKESAEQRYLIALIGAAIVATYSSANGLLLWPILIGAALLLQVRRTHLLALSIAAVFSIGLYFVGYKFTGTLSLKNLLLHPIYLIEFVGTYLSMPLGALKSSRFGMHLGVTAICIVVILAIAAIRSRFIRSRAGFVLFGFYLFVAMTALLTAAGRMDPADPTFSNAKPPRYVSGPLVAWGVFFLLCIWFSSRWRRAAGYVVSIIFALLLALALPKLRWWMQQQDTEFTRAQLAALAIEQGIYDPSTILGIFPDTISAELWSKGLHGSRLSVFHKSHAKWFGRPASEFARPVDASVPGQVTYTFPMRGGLEVAGWFDTSTTSFRHARWVLFENEAGQIVGFGRKLPAGFPDSIDSPHTPPSLGWVGFIKLNYAFKTFSTFVIDKRGLVPLEGPMLIPPEQIADGQHAGAQIPGIQWQMDPGWTRDGVPQHWPFGYAPQYPVYASWSGNDANTGRLSSSAFARPQDGCLILPVLQGPRGRDLSAGVANPATNQPIAHARFNNGPNAWRFWRMTIPQDVKQVRVFAEDNGKGWGQWLAVGPPLRCQ